MNYHINLETGNVSRCEAKTPEKCPLSEKNMHHSKYENAISHAEEYSKSIAYREKIKKEYTNIDLYHLPLKFSEPVEKLIFALESEKLKPLLVGGAVRDAINDSNQNPIPIDHFVRDATIQAQEMKNFKDLDFEIYDKESLFSAEQVIEKIIKVGSQWGKVDKVGKSFGVLKLTLKDGTDLDLSLPRTEQKEGQGHTGFTVNMNPHLTISDASSRRDFTINSMMYDIDKQVVIDPHQGMKDFKKNTLKHTSDAFSEDPLRVLRGFQFSSRFNMPMDDKTIIKSRELISEFDTISQERITLEWDKWADKSTDYSKGLEVLSETHWDTKFHGLKDANNAFTRKLLLHVNNVSQESGSDKKKILFSVLLSQVNKIEREKLSQQIILGEKNRKEFLQLSKNIDNGTMKRILTHSGNDNELRKETILFSESSLRDKISFALVFADTTNNNKAKKSLLKSLERSNELGILDKPEISFINGNDLLEVAGRKPGKWLKDSLIDINIAQAERKFKNKKEGLDYVKDYFKFS